MAGRESVTPEMQEGYIPEYEREPVGDYWLCAGKCGQWRKGIPAAHNGSGPVCAECEHAAQVARDYQRDHEDNFRGD